MLHRKYAHTAQITLHDSRYASSHSVHAWASVLLGRRPIQTDISADAPRVVRYFKTGLTPILRGMHMNSVWLVHQPAVVECPEGYAWGKAGAVCCPISWRPRTIEASMERALMERPMQRDAELSLLSDTDMHRKCVEQWVGQSHTMSHVQSLKLTLHRIDACNADTQRSGSRQALQAEARMALFVTDVHTVSASSPGSGHGSKVVCHAVAH